MLRLYTSTLFSRRDRNSLLILASINPFFPFVPSPANSLLRLLPLWSVVGLSAGGRQEIFFLGGRGWSDVWCYWI